MKKLICLSLFLLVLNSGCRPLDECSPFNADQCTRDYEINIPFELDSDSITYSVGDTFQLRMFLPDSILDLTENQMIDISNYLYQVSIQSGEMYLPTKSLVPSGLDDFRYFETNVGGLMQTDLIFEERNNGRECIFNVECQRSGIFYFMMNYQNRNLVEGLGNLPVLNFTETCCPESVKINNKLTNNFENHNYHLINNNLKDWTYWPSEQFSIDFESYEYTSRGFFLIEVVP